MEKLVPPAHAAAPPLFARLEADLRRVRRSMEDTTAVGPRRISGPLAHYVKRPGRLFRPVLTLVSAYVFDTAPSGPRSDRVVDAAAGMELLHLATLCHDDLCDRAATRRGHPTVNAAFGDDTALLTGDLLLACATSVFSRLGEHEMRVAGDTLKQICLGQMLEMADVGNLERTEDDYFSAVSGKTAALMATCARVGSALAGASAPAQETMASFGRSLGMAFQIWDDVLDIWAPPGITGKPSGQDIENGVFTLPVIHALREERLELSRLLRRRPYFAERHEETVRVLDRLGVRERAVETARGYITDALAGVRGLEPSVDAVSPLVEVARRLMPEIGHLLPETAGDNGDPLRP